MYKLWAAITRRAPSWRTCHVCSSGYDDDFHPCCPFCGG